MSNSLINGKIIRFRIRYTLKYMIFINFYLPEILSSILLNLFWQCFVINSYNLVCANTNEDVLLKNKN
jgi:hypothetical protein